MKLSIPMQAINCSDLLCKVHRKDINAYYNTIIHACVTATSMSIPTTRNKYLAGWNDQARPFKDQAIFWHHIWVE